MLKKTNEKEDEQQEAAPSADVSQQASERDAEECVPLEGQREADEAEEAPACVAQRKAARGAQTGRRCKAESSARKCRCPGGGLPNSSL